MKYNYAKSTKDSVNTNVGNNIFASEDNGKAENGVSNSISYLDLSLSYLLNPKTNMRLTAGVSGRINDNVMGKEISKFFYIAFRTSLTNSYYDF